MAALAGFSACRPEDKPPVDSDHTHTFNTEEWKYDGNYHWHPATCEHTNEQGDRAAHVYTETVKTEATCTEGALVLYECSCGYSYEETTNALGHDLHTVEAKAPSCEEDGWGEYQKCSRCDYKEGYKEFLKTGKHIYSTTKWEHDAISHWRPAICGCDRKSEEALHTFGEDGKCECGFEIVSNDAEIEATFLLEEVKKDDVVVGYVITGLTDAGKAKEVLEFPTYYKGNAVTSISARAFEDNAVLTEIKLSETITVIGREAFNNCTKLAKITFANRLEKIEESAFGGCEALTAAELPQTVTSLGAYAFDGCTALKTVSLPKSLKTLGDQAFGGCSSLEKIDIPASIGKINDNMFLNCSALSEVVLHEGTTSIGRQAFARCAALESVTLPRGLTFIGQSAFRGSGLKEIELPSTVETLASYAFAECDALAKATLSSSLTFSFGGWFAGSKALAEITIPFVGSEIAPDTAVSKAFGYIFTDREPATDKDAYVAAEEYGKTYYIPVALKKVTVLKGTVSAGAFDGCSQLEEIAVKGSVTLVSGTFENCTAKITWIGGEPMPELSDVTLSSENAEVGEEITLTYVASATCTVTVSVKKGEDAAAETDYTYNAETKKIIFNAVGSYTVTVEAKLGDNTVSKTATVTIVLAKPVLSDLDVSEKGDVDTAIDLGYTVDGESVVTVSVKKGAADVAEADYTFDAENKQITFKKPGNYTVTVIATRNEMTAEKSAQIRIVDPNAPKPEITLTAAESTVTEGAAVALTASVAYAEGTEKEEEGFTVTVKQGETYVAADASAYELVATGNKSFKPLVAGEYKITFTASNTQGGFSEKTVEITAEIADITLGWNHGLTPVNGYLRMATGATGTDLVYTAEGYAGGYDVTVEKSVAAAVGTLSDGMLSVSSAEADTVTYKIVYTHKADASVKKELSVTVGFVSDLVNAPVLGEDAFGGTYGRLIPSTGLMLYFNANDKDGNALTYADITYEIVSENIQLSDKSSDKAKNDFDIVIEKLHGLDNYPYILVKNFENNTATGTVTVKLTATKDGATAAATKVFEVKPLDKDGLKADGSDKKNCEGLNAYIDAVTGGKKGGANFDKIISYDNRQNSVVSKDGFIVSRGWANGNIMVVEPNGEDNFQVDFDYTPLLRQGDNTKVSFAINYRTGKWDGYCSSQTAFYAEGSATDITAGYWGSKIDQQEGEKPDCTLGTTIKVRIIHTVEGSVVTFKYQWLKGESYVDWLTYKADKSTENGNIGAPVYALQFNHEAGGYMIGNVKLTTAPELSVTLDETATVEEAIDLAYTTEEGATVTVSVKKGDAAAVEGTDYTYNKQTNKLHFLKEGTYKVTVTADNGMTATVEKTVSVTAPAPALTGVTLAETAETDASVTLAYTTDADGKTAVSVTVKKGAADATADDYTYTEATKTLVFKTAGAYTVTVTATRNGKTVSESKDITVTKAGVVNPEVTLTVTVGEHTYEGDELAFTASVNYKGETKATETLTVEIKNADGTFATATEGTHYGKTDSTFTPLVAGEFKITLAATTTNEGVASKTVTVTAEISQITLAWNPELTLTNGWYRVASGATGAELALNITGYAANYTVAVTKNGTADATLLADGKLTVQSDEPDTAEYAITYTHNADDTIVKKLSVKVSFVSDLANAPALGEDPFNGTYGKLIPGAGLLLYSDVSEGATVTFTATDATVATMDNVGAYVYVDNADNAKISVKLTATKNGATAAATKVFEVADMSMNDYIAATGYDHDAMNYGRMEGKHKNACIVTKDGTVFARSGKTLGNGADDLFVVEPKNANNFRVDFEFTPLERRTDSKKVSFTINYRPEHENGWVGSQVSFWSEGEDAGLSSGYWGDKTEQTSGTNPDFALGETIKIRILHTVAGNVATFRYEWSKDGNTYTKMLEFKVTTDKSIGKPIYAIQFNYEEGSFKMGNVELAEGPAAPEVTLGGNADIETPVTLGYTVTEGATATVSFQKDGGAAVENTDYTYNTDTKAIRFLTGGTYTVTVTATLNGVAVSTEKTVTVTVPEPELSDVTINDADGVITDGVINTGYALTYTRDGVSTVAVTVKKGENEAEENTDYTLADNTVTFKTPGVYTVTVTATRNGIDATKSVTVNIEDPALVKPDITFTVGEENTAEGTVQEGSAIALAVTVDYHDATKQSEAYAVTVERSGSFVTADADLYELSTDGASKSFTPKVAGKYRITLTATTTAGAFKTATVEVTATIVELTFAITETGLTVQNGSVLVAANSDAPASVVIPYALTGYTGGYELTVSKDDNIIWNTETENQLTASYQGENAGSYTFTYKHKSDLADKGLWKVFTVKVSFVADTANAITFGADPFGGTHGRLIPSTGMLLYFDAVDKDGNALTYADITYEIVTCDVKINGSETLADEKIYISKNYLNTANHESGGIAMSDYPYLMVENFENNTATGTITVKLTATKDGATAVAYKVFEVKPLNGDSGSANGSDLNEFIAAVAGEAGDVADYSNAINFNKRQNLVIGKDGIVTIDRTSWGGNVGNVVVHTNGSDNFQVDFTLIPMTTSEKISFAWKYVTGSASDNGETGHSALYYESDNTKFDAGCWSFADGDSKDWGDTMLDVTLGAKYYIRIIHTVVDGKVQITYQGSTDQVNYGTFFSATRNTSTAKGDLGSPVYGLAFYRENDLGHQIVGNFKLTYLD